MGIVANEAHFDDTANHSIQSLFRKSTMRIYLAISLAVVIVTLVIYLIFEKGTSTIPQVPAITETLSIDDLELKFVKLPSSPVNGNEIWISDTEITRKLFRKYIIASSELELRNQYRESDAIDRSSSDLPATEIPPKVAETFCAWLTEYLISKGVINEEFCVRLPYVSEWGLCFMRFEERCVREEEKEYLANHGLSGLIEVRKTRKSSAGRIFGLHGSVSEWCLLDPVIDRNLKKKSPSLPLPRFAIMGSSWVQVEEELESVDGYIMKCPCSGNSRELQFPLKDNHKESIIGFRVLLERLVSKK